MTELNANGQKQKSNVYLGRDLLAEQEGGFVVWKHTNPLTGSEGSSHVTGLYTPEQEPDPMMVDMGFEDPYIYFEEPNPDSLQLLGGNSNGQCMVEGMAWDCMSANRLREMGAADEVVPSTVYAVYKDGTIKAIWSGLISKSGVWTADSSTDPVGAVGSKDHAPDTALAVLAGTSDSSVTVIAGAAYAYTGQETDPPMLQGENNGKKCGIEVTFKPGSTYPGTKYPNGPSTISYNGPNFGLGFSVNGWVDEGGIGTIGVDSQTGKKVTNPMNPKGRWSLEQWTHSWIGENGKKIDERKTFSDLPTDEVGIKAWDNSFGFYDHPGGPPPSPGLARFENHLIKVYRGKTVCEVGFHFIQLGNTIHWGPGFL